MNAEENLIKEGLELQQKGKYKEAIESFEQARVLNPNDPKIREYLKKARELRSKLPASQQKPQNISYPPQVSKKNPEQYNLDGLNFTKFGKYKEAVASFDEAIAIKSDYSEAWNNRGKALCLFGRHAEALASFEKALTLNPNNADTWKKRGVLLAILVQYSHAVASFDKALAMNPNDADAWCSRGILLNYLNQNTDAIATYDKALAINPDHKRAWFNRDHYPLEEFKDYKKWMGLLDKVDEMIASNPKNLTLPPGKFIQDIVGSKYQVIIPNNAELWTGRGNILAILNRHVEAVVAFDNAIGIKQNEAYFWHNRGNALGHLKRYDEALASFEKALAFNPTDAYTWYNRGDVLVKLGRYSEAVASYDKANEINPNDANAVENRLWKD
jgi:superkiller protein 3